MAPLLSVCVPTYNGAAFLEKCLRSLLAQPVDLEIIVGDDASTDQTLQIARSLGDPRLRIESFDQRLGLAGNWNRTWSLARGQFVSLVGQDDFVDSHWAESLLGPLQQHPEANLAFGHRRFEFEDEESRSVVGDFFENRYPAMIDPFYQRISDVIPAAQMITEAMHFNFEINLLGEPSFVMVRRDVPESRRGFEPTMKQMIDWEFYTRFFIDRPLLHCAKTVGTYHIHAKASSIDNAPLSKHYREYDFLLDLIQRRFAGQLTPGQAEQLVGRQAEVKELAKTWADKEKNSKAT